MAGSMLMINICTLQPLSTDISHEKYKLLCEVSGTDLVREDSLARCLCNGLQEVWEASKA